MSKVNETVIAWCIVNAMVMLGPLSCTRQSLGAYARIGAVRRTANAAASLDFHLHSLLKRYINVNISTI